MRLVHPGTNPSQRDAENSNTAGGNCIVHRVEKLNLHDAPVVSELQLPDGLPSTLLRTGAEVSGQEALSRMPPESQDFYPTSCNPLSGLHQADNSRLPNFLVSFHLFSSLPPELRHQIWQYTFQPRVIEIHAPRRPHYAELGMALWQTRCYTHPALIVCRESRALALKHYQIQLWIGKAQLYLSRDTDTVVILGEMDIHRINWLLKTIVQRDPIGVGLTRIGLNAACWEYTGVRGMLRAMAGTMFKIFDEFVLVLYRQSTPPDEWRGGTCEIVECEEELSYRTFKRGKARELWDTNDWIDRKSVV